MRRFIRIISCLIITAIISITIFESCTIVSHATTNSRYDASGAPVFRSEFKYSWNDLADDCYSLEFSNKGSYYELTDSGSRMYDRGLMDTSYNSTKNFASKSAVRMVNGLSNDAGTSMQDKFITALTRSDDNGILSDSDKPIDWGHALFRQEGYDWVTDLKNNVGTDNEFIFSTASNNGDNNGYIFGCDFSRKLNSFTYYFISIGRTALGGDNVTIAVFSTDGLYAGRFAGGDTAIRDRLFNVVNLLMTETDKNIFGETITSGWDRKGKVNAINDILYCVPDKSECETGSHSSDCTLSMQVRSVGVYEVGRSGDDYAVNLFFDDYTIVDQATLQNVTFEHNVIFASYDDLAIGKAVLSEQAWGTVNDTFESGAGSGPEWEFIKSLLYEAANGTGAGTVIDYTSILSSGKLGIIDPKSTTYLIFSHYQEALEEAISRQYVQINDVSIEDIENMDDYFWIMNGIMRWQIKMIGESGTNPLGTRPDAVNLHTGEVLGINISGEVDPSISEIDIDLKTIWDTKLNEYQRNILSVAYIKRMTAMGKSNQKMQFVMAPSYTEPSELKYVAPEEVRDYIDDYEEQEFDPPVSVTAIARVCNIATRYALASSLYNVSSGEDADVNDIFAFYNANLEKFVSAQWDYPGDDSQDWYMAWMPRNIGTFGDKSEQWGSFKYNTSGAERVAALLYNVEYAFEVMTNSMYGTDDLHSNIESVKAFFEGDVDGSAPKAEGIFTWMKNTEGLDGFHSSEVEFGDDEFSINLLKSIIELHDMCKFLEIDPEDWSEVIRAYLQIYDDHEAFFSLMRNNNVLYKRATAGITTTREPLGTFFSIETKQTSDQWNKGFALSALYVPMETNLYDANSIVYLSDPAWISDFYYKYAFYRKALYINTDSSAIVNKAVTGDDSSGRKVATLRDLLNYERDIVLTIDDNFYNANQVSDIISRVDYTAVRNAGGDATEDNESTGTAMQDLGNWAAGLFDLDAGSVLKTGATQYYSQNLATNVTQLGATASLKSMIFDQYLLSADEILGSEDGTIKSVLDDYEYSVKQPYAVVSAIYRNADLYNECLRAITTDNAIFKSSKSICATPGTSQKDWLAVYNYCMLANLENQMKNNTNTTLDLDAPIFCDLFGNILTESGLVIIPAATNATLCGTNWTPYTVGWSEYYNNGNRLKVNEMLDDVYSWLLGREYEGPGTSAAPVYYSDIQNVEKTNAGGYMAIDQSEVLVLRDTELVSNNLTGIIQFDMPNKNSNVVQNLFFSDAYFEKAAYMYNHVTTNMIVEVLRGAPIEFINYEYESLSGNTDISKYGVYMAYKLEELMNALISGTNGSAAGGNSIVTMPNLAFVTGVEYIMLYVFKIIFALLLVALVVQLYLDATKNSLGLRSVGKFIMTCVMVLVAFTLVPKLVSWSYYKANKDLLAKESGYIMMLNYVKEYDGSEIGITNITTPETETDLYIRVSNVSVDWWDIIPDVLFGNTFATVTELYQDQLKDDAMAMQENVELKGDGLYINVQSVYDSTNLMYQPSNDILVNYSTALSAYTKPTNMDYGSWATDPDVYDENGNRIHTTQSYTGGGTWEIEANDRDSVVSYVLPYYVILDQLTANINEYNASRGIKAYGWGVGSNGHILTYDVLTPYLTSGEFLEDGFDILGMEYAIGIEHRQPIYNLAFTEEDRTKMQWSLWYPTSMTDSLKSSKLQELHDYARDYIADNRYILGKVPDEVFLKVFAMQLAIKYNQIFNVANGGAIEIINVDTRDMMRFMIGDKANVYKYYSYGFARYCYEEGGVIAVVFSAFLTVIYWLTSFLKPLAMIIILGLLVINVVFRKLLFHKESRSIEGYLIGCACLCLCNYMYALMLKLSMIMTDLGMGTVTALVMAFIVQIAYVAALLGIVSIEIKDWKDSGFNSFATIGANIRSGLLDARNVVSDRLTLRDARIERARTHTEVVSHQGRSGDGDELPGVDEYEYREVKSVEDMMERDRRREERGNFSQD